MSKHSQTEDVKFIYDEYINKNIAKLSEESGYLESGDEMDATRKDGFYDGPETTRLGALRLRLYFHPVKRVFIVCWKKINNLIVDTGIEDSHMQMSAQDIPKFRDTMIEILDEIESCGLSETPTRLLNENTACKDINSLEYWDAPCGTNATPKLTLRPYFDEQGIYYVRILYRRKSVKFPKSLGRSMSIPLGTCWSMVDLLQKMQKSVEQADEMRLGLFKGLKKIKSEEELKTPKKEIEEIDVIE